MRKIQLHDQLKAVFTQTLPGNDVAPPLEHGKTYTCKAIHTDKKGNDHIDVGLPRSVNYVTSFATGEQLPGTAHWCHPNRFIIVNDPVKPASL
jgi:hypothetical protein